MKEKGTSDHVNLKISISNDGVVKLELCTPPIA
jgi:hypothetical protein